MEAREIDKLFRDKLKHTATNLKDDSWTKLEAMLNEKKATPVFTTWRVAAAVLLLMVSASAILYWTKESPVTNELTWVNKASESFHKEVKISPEVNVEPMKTNDQAETETVLEVKEEQAASTTERVKQYPPKEVIIKKVAKEMSPELPVERVIEERQQLAEAPLREAIEEPVRTKRKFKSIKITYKRGKKSWPKQQDMMAVQQTDTIGGGKIKGLWAQTKEIKPGDLWADIRDAKDNLFQRNSKKNKVKNLNK